MSGKPDREPLGTLETLPASIAGLAAASAALMGIHERRRSGRGQLVEVSAQEVLILCTAYTAVSYSYSGVERPRSGMPFPMTIVPARDTFLGVNVLTQAQWEGLCRFAGLEELLENPDYATPLARALRSAQLTGIFAAWAASRDAANAFHEGQQWRVPFGYVPALADIFALEPHVARGFFEPVAHPGAGELQYPRPPFLMEGTPPVMAAPTLGRHSAAFERAAGGDQ
jgi:crotonobetainyl-CoA:carnitine CoA-transferase CaiB-like acyl-CoA transferase